jgi:polyisoprenoid-binding protein YceI
MKSQIIALLSGILASVALSGNWIADAPNAKINFSIKGVFGTVHGSFSGLKSNILFYADNPASGSISASIDAKTVNTGIGLRNHHLRDEEEWFNTSKYPVISFRSKKVQKTADGYTVEGDLTIKDVTRPVTIPFTFTANGNAGVFKGQFKLKRLDFHLGSPGGSVGEEVAVDLEVPVKK